MKKGLLFIILVVAIIAGIYVYQNKIQPTIVENEPAEENENDVSDLIAVDAPVAQASVTSPLAVSGRARGMWFFEAIAPVVVIDANGNRIGEGYVTAEGDSMTEEFVPFSGSIAFTVPAGDEQTGTVVFQRSNPSGLPENDQAVEIPVTFAQ